MFQTSSATKPLVCKATIRNAKSSSTLNRATELVTAPKTFVTMTRYEPPFKTETLERTSELDVALGIFVGVNPEGAVRHWNRSGDVPVAATEKTTLLPELTEMSCGCAVIWGGSDVPWAKVACWPKRRMTKLRIRAARKLL